LRWRAHARVLALGNDARGIFNTVNRRRLPFWPARDLLQELRRRQVSRAVDTGRLRATFTSRLVEFALRPLAPREAPRGGFHRRCARGVNFTLINAEGVEVISSKAGVDRALDEKVREFEFLFVGHCRYSF